LLAVLGFRPPHEVLPVGRGCVQKALDLDPSLPEAHAMLAIAAATWDHDWSEAERRFRQAMAHDPIPTTVRMLFTVYLVCLGRPLEAVEQIRRAVEQDPLFVLYRFYLAVSLAVAGQNDEAEREAHHMLELAPDTQQAYGVLAISLISRGLFTEALPFAEKAHALAPRVPHTMGLLAGLLARTGDSGRAAEWLQKLGPPETYGVPRALAHFHQVQGETEKAADWLERAIDQRDIAAPFMLQMPLFKSLRTSPRWPALAKRMNLPPEAI